jgi:hypothetical protein
VEIVAFEAVDHRERPCFERNEEQMVQGRPEQSTRDNIWSWLQVIGNGSMLTLSMVMLL